MKSPFCGALARLFLCTVVATSLSGCVSFYVDASVKPIASSTFVAKEPKHPVQVIYAFQTKGVDNARATQGTIDSVLDEVRSTKLFSEVSTDPVASGALLTITINDIPLTDNAAAKGFFTGMTFGLVGSTVGDGYICQVGYTPQSGEKPINAEARHAIYGTIGVTPGPDTAIKMPDAREAVSSMVHTIVSIDLSKVSFDPSFH